ncbi:hypothetical protein CA54_22300 [Symmachiella macrocystis]|uniref:Uncharacterized protein n=1 Tax=Symmachiella macrocystis TaxID=2527985 RepID=A0A5C6BMZ4_9PLAN|nr:hypothetical protein CA54_22300 [Symmachiella macrocystis]
MTRFELLLGHGKSCQPVISEFKNSTSGSGLSAIHSIPGQLPKLDVLEDSKNSRKAFSASFDRLTFFVTAKTPENDRLMDNFAVSRLTRINYMMCVYRFGWRMFFNLRK